MAKRPKPLNNNEERIASFVQSFTQTTELLYLTMLDSVIDAKIAATAERSKPEKKKRSKTPSLRQRLLSISRKSSKDSVSKTVTSASNKSVSSCANKSVSSNTSFSTKKRPRKVRFNRSNTLYPATDDYHGLVQSDLWWNAEALQARRMTDGKTLQKKAAAQRFLQECEMARSLVHNQVAAAALHQDGRSSNDTASTSSSSSSSSSCAAAATAAGDDADDEFTLSHGELLSFLTTDITTGLKKGYRGLEGGCLSNRYEHTQRVIQAILAHIDQTKNVKKKRSKAQRKAQREQQQAALAACSLELTRAHRQWARVLAVGDRVAIEKRVAAV